MPLLWATLTFVFFSAAQSKLPGYILPLFPALALLVALDLERRMAAPSGKPALGSVYGASGFTLLIAGIAFGFALVRAPQYLSVAVFAACLGLLPLALVLRASGRLGLAIAWATTAALAASIVLGYWLLVRAGDLYSSRQIGLRIRSLRPPALYLVGIEPLDAPSLLFYSRRSALFVKEIEQAAGAQPGATLVIRGAMPPSPPRGLRKVASEGDYSLWVRSAH